MRSVGLFIGVCMAAWFGAAGSAVAVVPADVLIQGGTVYSGAAKPPSKDDVVIVGEKIVYVGPDGAKRYKPREIVNAQGKIVAPGFIDAHAHPETYIRSDDARQRLNAPWLFQGATTLLIGVDGYGTPDVTKERVQFERQGIGTNLVPYVGFGAVRKQVLHDDDRAPSSVELNEMRKLVADYLHPKVLSEGVEELWVNGRSAIHAGKMTGQPAGRVLLHTPPAGSCP